MVVSLSPAFPSSSHNHCTASSPISSLDSLTVRQEVGEVGGGGGGGEREMLDKCIQELLGGSYGIYSNVEIQFFFAYRCH